MCVLSFFILLIGHRNISLEFLFLFFFLLQRYAFTRVVTNEDPRKNPVAFVSITGNSTKVSAKWKGKVNRIFWIFRAPQNKPNVSVEEARIFYRAWLLACLLRFLDFIVYTTDTSIQVNPYKDWNKKTLIKHQTTVVRSIYINVMVPYVNSSRLKYQRGFFSCWALP